MPLADLSLVEGSSLRSRTTLGGMCCKAASEDSEEVRRPGMSSCSVVQCTGAGENVNRQELQSVNRNTIARITVRRNLRVSRGVLFRDEALVERAPSRRMEPGGRKLVRGVRKLDHPGLYRRVNLASGNYGAACQIASTSDELGCHSSSDSIWSSRSVR